MFSQLNLLYLSTLCNLCHISSLSLPTLDVAQKMQQLLWSQCANFNRAIKVKIAAKWLDSMVLEDFSNPNYSMILWKRCCLDYISNSMNIFSCFICSCAQFYVFQHLLILAPFHVLFLSCYRTSLSNRENYLNSATRCVLLILSGKTSCYQKNVNSNNIVDVRSWRRNLVHIQ